MSADDLNRSREKNSVCLFRDRGEVVVSIALVDHTLIQRAVECLATTHSDQLAGKTDPLEREGERATDEPQADNGNRVEFERSVRIVLFRRHVADDVTPRTCGQVGLCRSTLAIVFKVT